MEITLNSVGKKFNRDWIFRELNTTINKENATVILGGNGSGKSTLLQIIGSFSYPSEGTLLYKKNNLQITSDLIYKHISFASPYQELIEEYTFKEIINFQNKLKPFSKSTEELESILGLSKIDYKYIKYYSSGMKQRVKLLLAICSNSDVLLLDEPISNLDGEGVKWFQKLLQENIKDRCLVVASNFLENEYFLCENKIDLKSFKI